MSVSSWVLWALVLIVQNYAFTYVSRARNSGSLTRHAIAAVFSNGVWFVSQLLIFSRMFDLMTGKSGMGMAIFTGTFYTVFTLTGSISAHYSALLTEKGRSAVGASKKYAQITQDEWAQVRTLLNLR